MLFKGPGSFKKNFKIGGNVDELKGYRLIPLTPPLFFHFTLPLSNQRLIFKVKKQVEACREPEIMLTQGGLDYN
jgi:hypothetical protein